MKKQGQNKENSELIFAPEDDEPGVHEVTRMSLKNFEFYGRGLEFSSACTALQAKEILFKEQDIAVAFVDVVMESEHAGLKLIKYIHQLHLDSYCCQLPAFYA